MPTAPTEHLPTRRAFLALVPEARELVAQMMRSQAFRERAAIRLFDAGLSWAPDARARALLLHDRQEEQEHYDAVADLWAGCVGEPRATLDEWTAARVTRNEVPLPSSWLDIAFAQFLYDRAGLWQLREAAALPFPPYADIARAIVAEESGHGHHGKEALAGLRASASPEAWTAAFQRWLRVALLSFGRPSSARAAHALALGLRRRSPAAVRDDFLRDIAPTVAALGLDWPGPLTLDLDLDPSVFRALPTAPERPRA